MFPRDGSAAKIAGVMLGLDTGAAAEAIPTIAIAALFGGTSRERDAADRAVMEAASGSGFMIVSGLPADVPLGPATRRALLRIFELKEKETRKLWRQKFAPDHANVYRGWFPLQEGHPTFKDGIDMGPDLAYGAASVQPGDPLCEPTPLPPEAALPGWRQAAAAYIIARWSGRAAR